MSAVNILDKNGNPFSLSPQELAQASMDTAIEVDAVSISQTLAADRRVLRTRLQIYQEYGFMASDPIIATALNLHITQSLGAHETTSEVFFIESKADIPEQESKIIKDIQDNLVPILNKLAYQVTYNAISFGDAYARVYSKPRKGVLSVEYTDNLHPSVVMPMMQAGRNVGYILSMEKNSDRVPMTNLQVARMKMPRMGKVSQQRILLNAYRANLLEDDPEKHHPLPDTIGGSFIQDAGQPYYMLQNALFGLNSSRIMDAIEESILTLNMDGMSNAQQKSMMNSLLGLLTKSKQKVQKAIETGQPISEKIRHVIPVSREKQLIQIDNGLSGQGNANSYNLDDVMFYARQLAAVLGHDLSMLGFSDQLSGGLGDGGFYRVSAQGAQRAIFIRQGFTDFIHHVIDIHLQQKYGGLFRKRPYDVVFVGAQTALEKEKQDIQERRTISAGTVLQNFRELKEQGFNEEAMLAFMKSQMALDEEDARIYTAALLVSENNEDENGEQATEAEPEE